MLYGSGIKVIQCCFYLQEPAWLTSYRVCHGFRLTKGYYYFWPIMTTFESSKIFGGSWGSIEKWLNPKTRPPSVNLACPNP